MGPTSQLPVAIPTLSPPITGIPASDPKPTAVEGPPDGYLVVAPSVLRAGRTETISFSLFRGDRLASNVVRVALVKDGRQVAETARGLVRGKGTLPLQLPSLPDGKYGLEVTIGNLQDETGVEVREGSLLFLETDKPIYKPGQPVHIRLMSLDIDLKPLPRPVTVEVKDPKGIKVYRKVAQTDEFGMATLEMPLSNEPNLGVWRLNAGSGERTAQVDIRVEEYVLPKFEVKADLLKEWSLANEPIAGKVSAEYTFGKPVKGEVEIVGRRYVGRWEEYARFTRDLDGLTDFELPPVGYVAGVPAARGMGNVELQVTVRKHATGYEEKTTRLVIVAATPVSLQVIPESSVFKPSLPLSFLIVAETPDNRPVDADVEVAVMSYAGKSPDRPTRETYRVRTQKGKALLKITSPADSVALTVEASSGAAYRSLMLEAGYSPSGNFIHVEQLGEGPLKASDEARFRVASTAEAGNFYYEVLSREKVVFTDFTSSPDIIFTVTPLMSGPSGLLVYQVLPNSEVAADYIPFEVEVAYPHKVEVGFSKAEARPGDGLSINVQTESAARVGLAAVDRSVFILAENRLNLRQVFAELERLYQRPQVELYEARFIQRVITGRASVTMRGTSDTFRDAGVVVMSNKEVPESRVFQAAPPPTPTPMPTAMPIPAAYPYGRSRGRT